MYDCLWPVISRIWGVTVTYTELLPDLLVNGLAAPIHLPPLTPPYPKSYDPNIRCNYHIRARGHSIENCIALKYKVRDLLRAVAIKFEFEK